MLITRTEIHFYKKDHQDWSKIDELSFRSKNLYNYVNYIVRQRFFEKGPLPNKFELVKLLSSENQTDYRDLPAQTSQQIIYDLFQNWSFFKKN